MTVSRLVLCVLLGVTSIDGKPPSKIVRGSNAYEGEFPYMVGLMKYSDNELFCGGSIIDSRHILTAAHCLDDVNSTSLKDIYAIAGTSNLLSQNATSYRIKSFIKHPQYPEDVTKFGVYDLAILTLSTEIEFDNKHQPVKLPTRDIQPGTLCQASGWGDLQYRNPVVSRNLQKLQMRVLTNEQCILYTNETIVEYEICALGTSSSGLCEGDSGDPLVCDDGTLVGVSSYGFACAGGYPDIFMRTWSFVDWIKKSISEQ